MGSAGLAHSPLRQEPSEFIYDKYNENTRGDSVRSNHGRTNQVPKEIISQPPLPENAALGLAKQSQTTPAVGAAYYRDSKFERVPYWQSIRRWKDVAEREFLSYRWNVSL